LAMALNCMRPEGCQFPTKMCLASCSFTQQAVPMNYKPKPLPEPDCWAILTPNGSRLVSPDEAKGRNDAYPLYTATQMYAYRDSSAFASGVDSSRGGGQE
jgi:hypothetical protein